VHETPPVAPDFRPTVTAFLGDVVPRVIPSTEIFQGDQEILIQHGDQTYRLRITRANRLILNK
jgi:hemin uptake protein HemP